MHLERELKIITCIFLGLLVFTDIFICAAAKSPFLICLVVSLAMTALYVAIILVLRSFYRRVGGIRRSTKKLITQETTDNEGLELIRNEMLSEGEFGKLSEAIYDLYTSILETADREKQQKLYLKDVISDMSHQFKTPIASLTLFTDILSSHAEEEGWNSRNIDILSKEQDQLERMRWLTKSLLQLARIETDAVIFKPVELPVQVLLKETASELLMLAEQKKVNLVTEGDEAILNVDPEWMHEALSNVVKNAIEHSPEGGTVRLSCTKTPLMTKLSVTDDGRGIPEDDRLRVFERFSRSSDAAAVNPASIGIGLSLSRSIIEGNGGRIYVESRFIDECKPPEKSFTTMNIVF